MAQNDRKARQVFFEIHSDLPREAPGSRDSTTQALALAAPLPPAPRVLDVGCGPGMQTMDLADLLPDAEITAVDLHGPYLAEVAQRARARGVGERVKAIRADMTALPFPDGHFDLIWSEGAAYSIGLARALQSWRPLLRPGGRLALTEAVWLRSDPPEELRHWWAAEYPDMRDVAACRRLAEQCGYRLLGDFVLPEAAWWQHYYRPMEARLQALAAKYEGDPVAREVLDAQQAEIDFFRRYAAYYGYLFLVLTVT